MKNHLLLIVLAILIFGCSVSEKPEFIKINSIEVISTSLKSITVQANLQFENKNIVSGTLQANDIHVFIDNKDVATINSEKFNVPKKSEFELPLQVTIPFDEIYNDNKEDLLDSLVNAFVSKRIEVTCKGEVRYNLGSFHYDYPVDYKQEVNLNK